MAHELNTTAVDDKDDISGTDLLFGASGASDPSPQPYTFNAIVSYTFKYGTFPLGSASAPSVTFTGDPNTGMWSPAADTLAWSTGGSERIRVNTTGDFLVGSPGAYPVTNGVLTPALQVHGTTAATAAASCFRWVNNAAQSHLSLCKSRGAAIGTRAIVASGDDLGTIEFQGDDGVNFQVAALITGSVDGTPGVGDMPGMLIFSTSADGAYTPTERMRINSTGGVGVGGAAGTAETVRLVRSMTGAANTTAINNRGQIQSDGTGTGIYYLALNSIAAGSYTITSLRNFDSQQGTWGSGATVSNQYGYAVQGNLIGAAKNFGFHSSIAAGTTRTITKVSRTSNVASVTTSVAHGYTVGQTVRVAATTNTSFNVDAVITGVTTVDATNDTFTYANTGSTVGVTADTGSAVVVGRWNFYASGSAPNYFNGSITIGATDLYLIGATPPKLQIHSASFAQFRWANDTNASTTYFAKSRGTTGVHTIVQSGDPIGQLLFSGSDGSAFIPAADIVGYVDGTPGTNDMPGRLVFRTTADGASAVSERMRIDSAGKVSVAASTASTDTTTGALVVTGGVGVGGAIYCGSAALSTSPTAGVGYATGAGGAVTQDTNRTTAVVLNKVSGAITLVSAAGSTSWQSFTLTNSAIAATDVVVVNQKSGTDLYEIHVTAVAAGSCRITFRTTGGTTTEQPVFNFAVIKAVAA